MEEKLLTQKENRTAWQTVRRFSPLILLILLVLAPIPLADSTASIRILDLIAIYCLLALGLNVVTGYAGLLVLGYAAFYADCQHEVRPVRSGVRLCLTYNLTLAGKRGKTRIAAPSYGETAAAIGKLLGQWDRSADPEKLAVTLDHRYSQAGLSIETLKGVDRARAEVLFEAAEQAEENCRAGDLPPLSQALPKAMPARAPTSTSAVSCRMAPAIRISKTK